MSSRKVIRLEDFAKELGNFVDESIERKKQAVIKGVARSIPDLVAASPVDTGLYAASWDFTVEEYGVVVGNYASYAGVIEDGARPFVPPIGPLLAWAKRVTGDPSQPPEYSSHVWALAKSVQKKISEVGMEPKHILENAIPMIIENIKQELVRLGE